MNKIIKTVISLILVFSNFCALAQYKFADIDWGTSTEETKEILTKKGYRFETSISEKLDCIASSMCVLNFSGPSVLRGRIVFRDKRLSFVGLDTGDRISAINALTKKYGPPQHDDPRGKDNFFRTNSEDEGMLYWREWHGSSLKINQDGYVEYFGGWPKAPADLSGYKNF